MVILGKKILYGVLSHGTGDYFASVARSCGAGGATLHMARGTAGSSILKALGIGSSKKDVVIMNASDDVISKVISKAKEDVLIKGVCAVIGGGQMQTGYDLITVIVNSGYSDDVMHVARKAGAIGGTVAEARGTALASDQNSFLGITIVPEKEMVYMICEKDKTKAIEEAVSNLECLQEKGMGVMFTQHVEEFVQLGK